MCVRSTVPAQAANPDAVIEDFVRWYSPRDWEADGSESDGSTAPDTERFVSGKLSQRMRSARPVLPMSPPTHRADSQGPQQHIWHQCWADTKPARAVDQPPLFDVSAAAEKVLHFLETCSPLLVVSDLIVGLLVAGQYALEAVSGQSLLNAQVLQDLRHAVKRTSEGLHSYTVECLVDPHSAASASAGGGVQDEAKRAASEVRIRDLGKQRLWLWLQ